MTIVDFDLHQIPPNIDIDFVVKEIILPRVPDGYAFQPNVILQKRSIPDETKTFKANGADANDKGRIESLMECLIETDSPRQLFPTPNRLIEVEIIERGTNQGEYLFSHLLKELDNLQEEQIPQFLRPIECASEQICESISVGVESEGSDAGVMVDEQAVSISVKEDFPWNQTKRADAVAEIPEIIVDAKSDTSDEDTKSDEM